MTDASLALELPGIGTLRLATTLRQTIPKDSDPGGEVNCRFLLHHLYHNNNYLIQRAVGGFKMRKSETHRQGTWHTTDTQRQLGVKEIVQHSFPECF